MGLDFHHQNGEEGEQGACMDPNFGTPIWRWGQASCLHEFGFCTWKWRGGWALPCFVTWIQNFHVKISKGERNCLHGLVFFSWKCKSGKVSEHGKDNDPKLEMSISKDSLIYLSSRIDQKKYNSKEISNINLPKT